MKKNKDVEKLSVLRLPPELDKLVSNLIRLDRKRHREELPGEEEIKRIIRKNVRWYDSCGNEGSLLTEQSIDDLAKTIAKRIGKEEI